MFYDAHAHQWLRISWLAGIKHVGGHLVMHRMHCWWVEQLAVALGAEQHGGGWGCAAGS